MTNYMYICNVCNKATLKIKINNGNYLCSNCGAEHSNDSISTKYVGVTK